MERNNNFMVGNLLDLMDEYFSKHYKLIAIDLSKQIELENPDLKQQINFMTRNEGTTNVFHHWKVKKQHLNFRKIL